MTGKRDEPVIDPNQTSFAVTEQAFRLMRTWYKTDADAESIGTFSAPIPASAFRDGTIIVAVEWQEGEVQVTYLLRIP